MSSGPDDWHEGTCSLCCKDTRVRDFAFVGKGTLCERCFFGGAAHNKPYLPVAESQETAGSARRANNTNDETATCFFCQDSPGVPISAIYIKMYRILEKEKMPGMSNALWGALFGGLGALARAGRPDYVMKYERGMVIVPRCEQCMHVHACQTGRVRRESRSDTSAGTGAVRPASDAAQFPQVERLRAEGWQLGEKPVADTDHAYIDVTGKRRGTPP